MNDFKNQYYKDLCIDTLQHFTYMTYLQFLTAYNETHRHFHTIEHLEWIFTHIRNVNSFYLTNDIIILTIMFHDIVYFPHFTNNEYRSAKFLEKHWKYSIDKRILDEVKICILDTKERKNPNLYCEIFNNADLSILYATRIEILIKYEQNIRKEFDFVESSLYKKKRIEFLKSMIDIDNDNSISIIIDYINNPSNYYFITGEENIVDENNILGFDE